MESQDTLFAAGILKSKVFAVFLVSFLFLALIGIFVYSLSRKSAPDATVEAALKASQQNDTVDIGPEDVKPGVMSNATESKPKESAKPTPKPTPTASISPSPSPTTPPTPSPSPTESPPPTPTLTPQPTDVASTPNPSPTPQPSETPTP